MPKLNAQIEAKLKMYPTEIQDIARKAIEAAQRMDATKVANMLEPKVKSTARKVVKK